MSTLKYNCLRRSMMVAITILMINMNQILIIKVIFLNFIVIVKSSAKIDTHITGY